MMKITHSGFEAFKKGTFGNAGANLFVDATGAVRRIADQDLTGNGQFDIIFSNSHGYIERGPTSIFTKQDGAWVEKQLPHDSCWKTKAVDVDGDGYLDLVIANGENGVTSILPSYVYWGGEHGLTGECSQFLTEGAYDAIAIDLTGNGLKDLVFTSAWFDHHYPGYDYKQRVFLQEAPRKFREATQEYPFLCNTVMNVIGADVNNDGYEDVVCIGYKGAKSPYGIGYIFYGGKDGISQEPVTFQTKLASGAWSFDLFGTGKQDLILAGGNELHIYRNHDGRYTETDMKTLEIDPQGIKTQFFDGRMSFDAADIDNDGVLELLIGNCAGLQIRKVNNLDVVWQQIDGFFCSGIKAHDFDGNGKMDIVATYYMTRKSYDTDSFLFKNVNDCYSFENVTRFETHGAVNVDVADLDNDGEVELIVCNTMYGPSQCDPEFPCFCYCGSEDLIYHEENCRIYPVDSGAYSYSAADVDNDGYPELALTSWDCFRVFQGAAGGPDPENFKEVYAPSRGITGGIIFADLNHDGYLDMIASTYGTDETNIFWGSPNGFTQENRTDLPTRMEKAQALVLADIDNDGYLDLIYGTKGGNLEVMFGSEDGFDTEREPLSVAVKNANGAAIIGCTVADINHDGKLEIVITSAGHYTKRKSYLNILFDPDNGYPLEKQVSFETGGTTGYLTLADLRKTGNLDLVLPFYSTSDSRVLPLRIFYNDGNGNFDFEHPLKITCESSIAAMTVDLDRNGYPDLLVCCHRNDLGHMVESLLYHNGPDGLDLEHPQKLLGYGPHDFTRTTILNTFDRSESEYYQSVPVDVEGSKLTLSWEATQPNNTKLNMRVRFAENAQKLDDANWSEIVEKGATLEIPQGAKVMQYQAEFFAPNACGSPRLTKVEIQSI